MAAANPTLKKFGYPEGTVAEGERWAVLLRPQQVTLGALVLVCKEPVRALGEVSPEGMVEFGVLARRLEIALGSAFKYDKINYLLLMMVDPDVHFHVLPRYGEDRPFAGGCFRDFGWPGPPVLDRTNAIDSRQLKAVQQALVDAWPKP